ncbi:S-adenosyl-L-methionine-dependent methyltransferase [Cristinia sonorae]|uniref:Cytosine-specific methyltransferase n=1 Tax=Cristinia sonorae TaxID=1940300 RepID=A0A8K0XP01_9AGAR|nr:S-adenosyl-L-methionine-dependent methyltransferase [Cristinia sonorae]
MVSQPRSDGWKPNSRSQWCGALPGREPTSRRSRRIAGETLFPAYIGKRPFRKTPESSDSEEASQADEQNRDVANDDVDYPIGDVESEGSKTVVGDTPEPDVIYVPSGEEALETCDLVLEGEQQLGDDEDTEDDEDDSVPVRALIEFTVYNLDTKALVPFHVLYARREEPNNRIGASGLAAAWLDDQSDVGAIVDDEEPLPLIKLSDIVDVNVNDVNEDKLDRKIYLRTQYAWYILDAPSPTYAPYFETFWKGHCGFHLVVSCAEEDERLEYDDLKNCIDDSQAQENAESVLGTPLVLADFEGSEVREYIASSMQELLETSVSHSHILSNVPIIQHFLKKRHLGKVRTKTKDTPQLKPRTDAARTIVTYRVRQYAQGLFIQPMQVVGEIPSKEDMAAVDPIPTVEHQGNHRNVRWGEELVKGTRHYKSVMVDGVEYKIGDSVITLSGLDSNITRQKNSGLRHSKTSNPLANEGYWFGKICYFFQEGNGKYFHVQWYEHGSKILLQETAHPQGLFLTNECDDADLDCIFQRCNVKALGPSEEEPLPDLDYSPNDFFYTGLTWYNDDATFMEVTSEEEEAARSLCDEWQPCYPCGLKVRERADSQWTPVDDNGMSHLGVHYHTNDFVYMRFSPGEHGLYRIGQIIRFYQDQDKWFVDFKIYARQSLVAKASNNDNIMADNRRLYMTSKVLYYKPLDFIDGKVFVVHPATLSDELEAWVQHDDHFYVDLYCDSSDPETLDELHPLPATIFTNCAICYEEQDASLKEQAALLEQHGPLAGLELFAGAGGLSTGFTATGYVKTKWAVEYVSTISKTYRANHPGTVVYNQCSNALLKHAVQTFEGQNPRPLQSLDKNKPKILPPMPKPGEVDFIYGGPPCQSFSGMNHNKKENDARSAMPCNMLSYVEFYKPKYFLLENVKGMVHFKLTPRSTTETEASAVGFGVIKFILRALIGLGYQARFKLLQAGQYGAPQGRLRVIFWGARRRLPLPKFPMPTHFFELSQKINLPTGDALQPPARMSYWSDWEEPEYHQCAPMPPVTAMDAMSDLPRFDWINPHQVIKRTAADAQEVSRRKAEGIAQFPATNLDRATPAGYNDPIPYPKPPQNRYQLFMREKLKKKDRVTYHYSARFPAITVERVCSVPMEPKANHHDLPPPLALSEKRRGNKANRSVFCRIDGEGHFRTALTTINPGSKGGSILHPDQKRILTVRECARSQGFPDHYEFVSEDGASPAQLLRDQTKQIGNAVPIPLAIVLGKEVGKALFKWWKMKERMEEAEREASPEMEMYDSEVY